MLQQSITSLRSQIQLAADSTTRGKLRIRLADHLAAGGNLAAAAIELQQAASEIPLRAAAEIAARAIGAHAAGPDRAAFLRACGFRARDQRRSLPAARASRGARPATPPSASSPASTPAPAPVTRAAQPLSADASPWPAPAAIAFATAPPPTGPSSLLEAALAAWAERKPVRARRLAEEVARLGVLEPPIADQLRELVTELDAAGFARQSLLLARALCEPAAGSVPGSSDVTSLAALIDRAAAAAGSEDLQIAWTADLGGTPRSALPGAPTSPAVGDAGAWTRFRDVERQIYLDRTRVVPAALADSAPALPYDLDLSGTRIPAVVALALADSAVTPTARCELWRRAFAAESDPVRRAMLAERWMAAELTVRGDRDADGDSGEDLLSALTLAISSVPDANSHWLRRLRAERLRTSGRLAELAVALGEDAKAAPSGDRAERLAEQGDVWAELGEAQLALEARLEALTTAPGLLRALAPARRQLEAEGRRAESLALAVQALPCVKSPNERVSLLRQLAALSEAVPGGRRRAAAAWLDVLKLHPDDAAARAGALRTLSETAEHEGLAEFLAWTCAQEQPPDLESLWRLAEFRRLAQRDVGAALPLYRWIAELRATRLPADGFALQDEEWKRKDDALALHGARALAAPTAAQRALALVDRALALMDGGQIDAADRDLNLALDLDMGGGHAVAALEKLHSLRNDFRGFRQRLQARAATATGAVAAQLWFGIGRANERLGEPEAAVASYARAIEVDEHFVPAIAALRKSAWAKGDFSRAAQLLEREVALASANPDFDTAEKRLLLVDLGVLRLEKLNDITGAIASLEEALLLDPADARAQLALFEATLAMGTWERAGDTLEASLSARIGVNEAARNYHRVGLAAEGAGRVESALTFYSRSYARMTSYRPTLERLSELCFERQQWDNAWKATEHLLETHGADLDLDTRAALAMRAGLADLHIAQRFAATNQVAAMLSDVGPSAGIRDVADSWASMRIEPRLLVGIEHERRGRILSRLGEVLSLTQHNEKHPARQTARQVLASLAMVDKRWADALAMLDALGGDESIEPRPRAGFWIAAGDIFATAYQDLLAAGDRYQRAAHLAPGHSRLARQEVRQLLAAMAPQNAADPGNA